MRPFEYSRAATAADAVRAAAGAERAAFDHTPANAAPVQLLAGGTLLLDLMKLDTMQPAALVDINDLSREHGAITADADGLRLGALTRMAEAADHPVIRADYPVIAQSLQLAASAQLRNMASLAGNVLQRTRCAYFRDPSYRACNKRDPGSGCSAINGLNRRLAVLGTSESCIASYPGDFAQALVALDATVDILGPNGTRTLRFESLHRLPGATPHIETVLAAGDVVTGFTVPAGPWTRRSVYVKIRDRESYEFGLATAAVALDLDDDMTVRTARIALGGVATIPWRAHDAEAALGGRPLNASTARDAADAAFAGAVTHGENAFKPELGRRTLLRALYEAARLEL